jgi:hypothetical protein
MGVIGSVASVISLVFVVRDLPKALEAARAAQAAAERAQRGLDERLRIADASECAQLAREVETHLREPQDWTAAFYRAQELYVLVLELQAIPTTGDAPSPELFAQTVNQLYELRNELGKVIADNETRTKRVHGFDADKAIVTLRLVQDEMHKWKACLKRKIVEGAVE